METIDGTRLGLGIAALDRFTGTSVGCGFEALSPDDRSDALFDLLTALRVVADGDPALDWDDALRRLEDFYPVRARATLP